MTKKSRKYRKSQSPFYAAYRAQRIRVLQLVRRLESQGWDIDRAKIPDIPNKITAASVRRLKRITAATLMKKGRYIDRETGEILTGAKAKKADAAFRKLLRAEKQKAKKAKVSMPKVQLPYFDTYTDKVIFAKEHGVTVPELADESRFIPYVPVDMRQETGEIEPDKIDMPAVRPLTAEEQRKAVKEGVMPDVRVVVKPDQGKPDEETELEKKIKELEAEKVRLEAELAKQKAETKPEPPKEQTGSPTKELKVGATDEWIIKRFQDEMHKIFWNDKFRDYVDNWIAMMLKNIGKKALAKLLKEAEEKGIIPGFEAVSDLSRLITGLTKIVKMTDMDDLRQAELMEDLQSVDFTGGMYDILDPNYKDDIE